MTRKPQTSERAFAHDEEKRKSILDVLHAPVEALRELQ
jgi:hypothetical protein